MNNKLTYFIIAIVVLILDQASKAWASAKLQYIDTMEIIPDFFRFTYARNRGVAFSLFADSQFETKWILASISAIAAIGVSYYLIRSAANSRRMNLALSFLLAGIVGNLIDRVRLGEVVDFIDFHWYEKYTWPTFNIADASICVGAFLLALEMIREEKVSQAQTTEG
ncbi:MAG: signal peptidase II [Acidobacteria bacterium]|nr:signal peptidase II [Acidobacteriota bacterium]